MASNLNKKGLVAVSDKVILAAQPALELVRLFVTDFSTDPGKQYQTVNVKVLAGDAHDFVKASANYTTGKGKADFADIVLDQHKVANWTFDDADALEDDIAPIWDNIGRAAGRAIGKAFVNSAMGLLTYDKAEAQKTVATSSFADFVKFRSAVEAAGYDPADTVLLLEPTTYDALLGLLDYKATGASEVVEGGIIGRRLGFAAILNAPNADKTSASGATKGIGFAVPTGAIGFANRYRAPIRGAVGNLVEAGYTVDEETGLVIGTRVVVNQDDGELTWNAEVLFGAALMKQSHTISTQSVANGAPGFVQLVTA